MWHLDEDLCIHCKFPFGSHAGFKAGKQDRLNGCPMDENMNWPHKDAKWTYFWPFFDVWCREVSITLDQLGFEMNEITENEELMNWYEDRLDPDEAVSEMFRP